MSIQETDRGNKCPHGDIIGQCPSSMCYVWTVEDIFEDEPEKAAFIRVLEGETSAALGKEVILDFPAEQEERDPHPCYDWKTCYTFCTREDNENTVGALEEVMNSIAKHHGYEVKGSYITHVIVGPISA